ncbi:hypothetical protein V6N13_073719 [Hibiscus sabdariffa]
MSQIQNQIIVFVSNLPPCLHWQGLWFAFARHVEVSDAFIPMKKSKSGTRFGFVRFLSLEYVERAISRMNGSVLFWSLVFATLARFSDGLESRMSKQVKNIVSNKDASREDLSHPSRRDNVVEYEKLSSRDFTVKRARILTNSMNFIEDNITLSCNGSLFLVKLRDLHGDGRLLSVEIEFDLKDAS